MNSVSLIAPAKINLFLDITGKLPHGYHEIYSVMQSIDIFDYIDVEKSDDLSVICDNPNICGEKNIAYKALTLFFEQSEIKSGARINIKKNIPLEAGMAGGSADAAAVLKGLNILFDEPFSEDELYDIGEKCGSDVPFCIKGGTMLCEGKGEKLFSLPDIPDCTILIVKPNFGMSTAESYKYYDEHQLFKLEHPCKDEIISSLEKNSLQDLCKGLYNILEATVEHPQIKEIKHDMLNCGAYSSLMTGSGTAVFGIFDSMEAAVSAKTILSEKYGSVFITRPYRGGASVDKSATVYKKLDSLNVDYERLDHTTVYTMDDMYFLGIFDKGIIGKNLFLRDNKGKRHFLVFLYGDKHADLSSIQDKIGIKHCSFGSAERLFKYLGLTKGSVSPLGVVNDTEANVEFIIDRQFIGCPIVGVHPNQNTSTIWISFDDLYKVIKSNGNSISFIDI